MKVETKFCQTCNARERVIEHGKCIVCGHPPSEVWKWASDPLTWGSQRRKKALDDMAMKRGFPTLQWPQWPHDYTGLDRYVAILCVLGTLYVVLQVVRWLV